MPKPLVTLQHCTRFLAVSMAIVSALTAGATAAATEPPINLINPARQSELVTLVRQDCGSCHGLTLQGGLGPALLPETLQDKPADYLQFVILHGRPGTAMPPWKRFLSETEATWIVANLQKGFPGGH